MAYYIRIKEKAVKINLDSYCFILNISFIQLHIFNNLVMTSITQKVSI